MVHTVQRLAASSSGKLARTQNNQMHYIPEDSSFSVINYRKFKV